MTSYAIIRDPLQLSSSMHEKLISNAHTDTRKFRSNKTYTFVEKTYKFAQKQLQTICKIPYFIIHKSTSNNKKSFAAEMHVFIGTIYLFSSQEQEYSSFIFMKSTIERLTYQIATFDVLLSELHSNRNNRTWIPCRKQWPVTQNCQKFIKNGKSHGISVNFFPKMCI